MNYVPGEPFAWFFTYGRGYGAEFALPSYRRTRYLRGCDGNVLEFATSHEAIAAAQEHVNKRTYPKLTTHREPDEKSVAKALGVANWKRERVEVVRRGPGKEPFFKVRGSIA